MASVGLITTITSTCLWLLGVAKTVLFQEQRRSKLLPVGKLRTGKLAHWGHGYHLQGFARDIEILSNLLDTGCGYMRSPCRIHGCNGGMETMSSCAPYECVGSPCDRHGRYGCEKYGLLDFPIGFLMVWSCHAMPWWNSGHVFGCIPQDISIPEIPTFVSSSPIPKITIPNTTRNGLYKSSKMGGWFFGFTTSVIYRWKDHYPSGWWMVLRSFPVPRWWHCPCSAGWHWSRNSRGSWVTWGWFRQSWPSNKRENREWMKWAPLFSDKPKRIRMKGFGASKMMIGYLKLLGNQQTAGPDKVWHWLMDLFYRRDMTGQVWDRRYWWYKNQIMETYDRPLGLVSYWQYWCLQQETLGDASNQSDDTNPIGKRW